MAKRIIMEGRTFERLTVLSFAEETTGRAHKYKCRCQCGKVVIVLGASLRRGATQSCGCLRDEKAGNQTRRHGKSGTRIHNIWSSMIQRCRDENCPAYPAYGGRGIAVCEEWQVFENFYRDMGDAPKGLTLERKNNDFGYSKDNCEWATRRAQANNRRNSRLLTFNGKTQTHAQWARELGLRPSLIWERVKYGWPVERILTASDFRYPGGCRPKL
jgi:hypothetical protein